MLHYAAQLSAALSRQPGLNVTVLLPQGADTRFFSEKTTLHFADIPDKVSAIDLLKIASGAAFLALYRAIQATRPDIVHLNSGHPLLVLTLPILSRNFKIVATVHDAISHPGIDRNIRKHLERRVVIRNAQIIFVHREIIRSQLIDQNTFLKKENVLITPHGDYNFFSDFENGANLEPDTLLFFGRISTYKGLEYLVEAVALIRDKYPKLRVIIAGYGDPGKRVSEAFADPIYEVHNRFIDDSEIATFFRRAAIVVLPYIEASESGVIQIAKAFLTPVVSTRVGGIPDAIQDKQTGLLVNPSDSVALAEAVDLLLSDQALYKQIEQNIEMESTTRAGWEEASQIIASAYHKLSENRTS